MFCCILLCVLSSFAVILMGKREREVVALLCLSSVSCDCYCSVVLPRGVRGWSAVCGCGISSLYLLAFFTNRKYFLL